MSDTTPTLSAEAVDLIARLAEQARTQGGSLPLAEVQSAFDAIEIEDDGEEDDPEAFFEALTVAGVEIADDVDEADFDQAVALAERALAERHGAEASPDAALDAYSQWKREAANHRKLTREEESALSHRYLFCVKTAVTLSASSETLAARVEELTGKVAARTELIAYVDDDPDMDAEAHAAIEPQRIELRALEAELAKTAEALEQTRHEAQAAKDEASRVEATFLSFNFKLVMLWAGRVHAQSRRRAEFLDLIQEGNVGMLNAWRRFDPTKGWKFSTWATWMIKEKQQAFSFEQVGAGPRIPTHRHRDLRLIRRFSAGFARANDRTPTIDEIAEGTNKTRKKIIEILQAETMGQTASLDAPVNDDGDAATMGDFVADTFSPTAAALVENQALREALDSAFSRALNPRERRVLLLRFGFYDGMPHTLEWIGKRMNITRERVRQIQEAAFKKLRRDAIIREMWGDIPLGEGFGDAELDAYAVA